MWKKRLTRVNRAARERDELSLESLEARMLLSGNVQASLDDGTLSIIGDSADNAVFVSTFYDAQYGSGFRVEGLDHDGPTTINNGSASEFFGVTNLYVDLNDGDDDLGITNDIEALTECLGVVVEPTPDALSSSPQLEVPGWTTIRMGAGENRFGMGPATIGQRLLIETGSGHDQVGLCGVDVGSHLVIRTFGGYDEVFLHDSASTGLTKILAANGDSTIYVDGFYADDLVVQGGYHEDDVGLSCLYIEDDVVVQTLNGYDWVYVDGCEPEEWNGEEPMPFGSWIPRSYIGDILSIQTADGGAEIDIDAVDAGRINILGGSHDDYVNIQNTYTQYNLNVNTLDGHDYISASEVDVLNINFLSGPGDDEVFLGGYSAGSYVADDVSIVTGIGNDLVRIGEQQYPSLTSQPEGEDGVNIEDNLVINTGEGIDRIDIAYYDVGGNVTIDAGGGDDRGGGYDEGALANSAQPSYPGGLFMYDMEIYGHLNVFLGSGNDSAEIEYIHVGGNAYIDAGTGDEGESIGMANANGGYGYYGVQIYGLTVEQNFWLVLGTGFDNAYVSDLYVGNNAFFNAGANDDQLVLYYVEVVNNLYVYMGGGNDDLDIDSSSAANAWLYGQAGSSDFLAEGNNSFGSKHVFSFELFVI